MKHSVIALALLGAAAARPTPAMKKREVPQEHSHRNILNSVNILLFKNNPLDLGDNVFGLLGAAAAAEGAGNLADPDCLQQAIADQAFTNAKADGDVDGMTAALIYRALERNTGQVGLASVACESIVAVNPEIAALQQHQDPAGDGAQELNKQIAEELARQIAAIGGDPLLANEASTFAPGELDDATAAGNTCNDPEDEAGCINSLNLRVDDLSEDEIAAAVAGIQVEGAAKNATVVADPHVVADPVACDNQAAEEEAAKEKKKAAKEAKKAAKEKKKAAKEAKKAAKEAKKAEEKAAKEAAKEEEKAAEEAQKAEEKAAKEEKKAAKEAKKAEEKEAKEAAKEEEKAAEEAQKAEEKAAKDDAAAAHEVAAMAAEHH